MMCTSSQYRHKHRHAPAQENTPTLQPGCLVRVGYFTNVASRAVAAGKHVEEVDHVLILWKDIVVVEVDVVAGVAGAALAAGEDGEEVNNVLIFGEDGVVVEVDAIAAARGSDMNSDVGGRAVGPHDIRAAHSDVASCSVGERLRAGKV